MNQATWTGFYKNLSYLQRILHANKVIPTSKHKGNEDYTLLNLQSKICNSQFIFIAVFETIEISKNKQNKRNLTCLEISKQLQCLEIETRSSVFKIVYSVKIVSTLL
ncbi:Hypothetical predicted protein [Octopus vulgaris]|uniref:Uncharacterized protein n=1 Tax=Octopus vulgaris TaxID=6645 RepID=A0AA36ALZ2_OCTVU|nr:Hypothetical predicted protein [Octopus vulgaris]